MYTQTHTHTHQKWETKQTNITNLGVGLILGGDNSSKMETVWKHENVDFLLYLLAYLSNQGGQKSIKNGSEKF